MKTPAHTYAPGSIAFTVLIGTVAALQAASTTVTLPALPGIAAGLDTTPAMAQFTVSGFLLGVACGQVLSGAVSDRYGRRPVLLAGLLLAFLTGIGCTFAQDIGTLIAMRVLQGFGAAASMILGRAIIRDVYEGQQALRAMSNMATTRPRAHSRTADRRRHAAASVMALDLRAGDGTHRDRGGDRLATVG